MGSLLLKVKKLLASPLHTPSLGRRLTLPMPFNKTNARPRDWPAWIFIACIFLVFMQAGRLAGRGSEHHSSQRISAARLFSKRPISLKHSEHPIQKLMADAEENFNNMLSRQSKTLEDAVVEYRRRYGREPPRGFGHWWQFAQEHDVKLVDEFDAIHEDLAPFWNMSAAEFRDRAFEVSLIYLH